MHTDLRHPIVETRPQEPWQQRTIKPHIVSIQPRLVLSGETVHSLPSQVSYYSTAAPKDPSSNFLKEMGTDHRGLYTEKGRASVREYTSNLRSDIQQSEQVFVFFRISFKTNETFYVKQE